MTNLKVVPIEQHKKKAKVYDYCLYASCVAFFAISAIFFLNDISQENAVYFYQAEIVASFAVGYFSLKAGKKNHIIVKAFLGYSVYTMMANMLLPPASSLQWFLELFLFFFFAFCFYLKEQL